MTSWCSSRPQSHPAVWHGEADKCLRLCKFPLTIIAVAQEMNHFVVYQENNIADERQAGACYSDSMCEGLQIWVGMESFM